MALTKIDDRGLKTPIDLLDNEKIRLGSSQDLQIYHDGSASYIDDAGTGILRVRGNEIRLCNTSNETYFTGTENGAAKLYYNDVVKLETTNTGAWCTGNFTLGADDNKVRLGTHQDLDIYHGSDVNYIQSHNNRNLEIKHGSDISIKSVNDGAVELYYDGSKKFHTHSTGVTVTGYLHIEDGSTGIGLGNSDDLKIYHDGANSYISHITAGQNLIVKGDAVQIRSASNEQIIETNANGAVQLFYDASKKFETTAGGTIITGTLDTTGTITGGGHIKTGSDSGYFLAGASNDLKIYHDGNNSKIINETGNLTINATATEAGIDIKPNGSVELYHNGTKKFETFEWGTITQGISKMVGTAGGAAQVYLFADNESVDDRWRIDAEDGGVLQIQSMPGGGSWENAIKCYYNAQVELYHNNNLKLTTTSSGVTVTGSVSTNDINLSNLNASPNEVDGTQGSWTMQEGANDLFLINRSNGKKYKFNLTEIS